MILLYLNLAVVTYQGYYKPLISRAVNWIEAINELHIEAATLNMMLFTNWVHDAEVRYLYGWSFIIIMLSQMLWNLLFVLWNLSNVIRLILIKCYNRIEPKLRKCYQSLLEYCCSVPPEEISIEEIDPNTTLHLNYKEK